jgi:hypothetical protein
MSDELTEEEKALVKTGFDAFNEHTHSRHMMGAEKYGENTFLDKDLIQMCLDEIADAANYLRYQYAALYVRRKQLEEAGLIGEFVAQPREGKETLGKDSVFNPYKKEEA